MDLAHINIKMGINFKDCILKTKREGKENITSAKVEFFNRNLIQILHKSRKSIFQTVQYIKDSKKKELEKVVGNVYMSMEVFMMECGKTIKNKVKVIFNTLIKVNISVNGIMINEKGQVHIHMLMAIDMKVNGHITLYMETERIFMLMVIFIKDNGFKVRKMVKGFIFILIMLYTKVSG
jgi:hypothetical protein